jgi:hypothetical protein
MEKHTIHMSFEGIGNESIASIVGDLVMAHCLDASMWSYERDNDPPEAWRVTLTIHDSATWQQVVWTSSMAWTLALERLVKLANCEEDGLPGKLTLRVQGPYRRP